MAGIAARILTLMQGSEKKKKKNAVRIELEHETWHTCVLITTPQRRRCRIVKVPYLARVKEKKALDGKYMATLC